MMRYKRGDLVNATMGIVLALVGIVIFVSAAYQLYQLNVNQDAEQAKEFLETLVLRIDRLGNGDTAIFTFQGVEGWTLAGWGIGDMSRPDRCSFASCLCVCTDAAACEEGVCQAVDAEAIRISGSTVLSGTVQDRSGQAVITREGSSVLPYISFPDNLFELSVSKNHSVLSIAHIDAPELTDYTVLPPSGPKL